MIFSLDQNHLSEFRDNNNSVNLCKNIKSHRTREQTVISHNLQHIIKYQHYWFRHARLLQNNYKFTLPVQNLLTLTFLLFIPRLTRSGYLIWPILMEINDEMYFNKCNALKSCGKDVPKSVGNRFCDKLASGLRRNRAGVANMIGTNNDITQ